MAVLQTLLSPAKKDFIQQFIRNYVTGNKIEQKKREEAECYMYEQNNNNKKSSKKRRPVKPVKLPK